LIYAMSPTVLIFALGYFEGFRILGRHFTPLMPVILGLLAFGVVNMRRSNATILLVAAFFASWFGSSLSLRFSARHRKDDYREAAAVAKATISRGETVWWSADAAAAAYYGVPLVTKPQAVAILINGWAREDLEQLPVPDVVATSKPDVYDPSDQLGGFVRDHHFQPERDLPAFTIWRRPGSPAVLR
jgi:hypothetical protein